jgi:hypothetical protein
VNALCLDLSTHAGHAWFQGEMGHKPKLKSYGTIHLDKSVHSFGKYPFNYSAAAREQLDNIWKWVAANVQEYVDVVIVEETNAGRNRYTQKLLEFLHKTLVDDCKKNGRKLVYLDSSGWRHNLGLVMTKEQKKANAKLRKAMRDAKAKGEKVDKKALGIKGLTTPKHVAIAHANTTFGLNLKVKDNDAADAICLGLAYFNHCEPCDGV